MAIHAKIELRRELTPRRKGQVLGAVLAQPHEGTAQIAIHSSTIQFLLSDVPEIKAALDEIVAEAERYTGGKNLRALALAYAEKQPDGFTTAHVSEQIGGALTHEEISNTLWADGYELRRLRGSNLFGWFSPVRAGGAS